MTLRGRQNGAFAVKILDGATSSESDRAFNLERPARHFSLQVAASTSAVVSLRGYLTSASTVGIELIRWSSDTVGSVLSTESTGPVTRLTAAVIDAGSSGTDAWVAGAL